MPGDTSLKSIALRINFTILKTRQIGTAECCWLLMGLPLFKSTASFPNIPLATKLCSRQIDLNSPQLRNEHHDSSSEDEDGAVQHTIVKKTKFDEYCAWVISRQMPRLNFSFHEWLLHKHEPSYKFDVVPNYTHASLRVSYPWTEHMAQNLLYTYFYYINFLLKSYYILLLQKYKKIELYTSLI